MYKLFRLMSGDELDNETLLFIQTTIEGRLRDYLKRVGDVVASKLQKQVVDYVTIALSQMRTRVTEASMQDDTGRMQLQMMESGVEEEFDDVGDKAGKT